MNEYEITTRTESGKFVFLTKGTTPRDALRRLISQSADFRIAEESKRAIRITIKKID